MQKTHIHQSHIYRQIKILQTIFEKGHPRNIPVKLFQNLTSSFWQEDFLRISSCLYSARSPHSPQPCLWTDQNFANNFWKGSLKEHSCEIISKSDLQFRRRRFFKNFFMSLYSARSPHSLEPCFWVDQNFANDFWKGSPKEHSCKIISKSDQWFRRRFFKNFFMYIQCKKPPFTRAMFKDGSKFREQFLKRVTRGIFLWNYFKIWPGVSEKKIF